MKVITLSEIKLFFFWILLLLILIDYCSSCSCKAQIFLSFSLDVVWLIMSS